MLQNANESEFSNTWQAVSAELFICAVPIAVKFHRCPPFGVKFTAAISFDEILPSLGFPWHSTDFNYRVLWGKISLPSAIGI
ncbi:hypothetical protein [Campylobacter sp.]|uniref:hypothetical protein n=1 Tax=Campylobacter sp. TaxID=205 RepID=UPI0025E4237E|nr:hypothetical protein [Campylobacter sp.]